MKKINCPLEDQVQMKTNIDGTLTNYIVPAKQWDLNHFVNNGSKDGVKQRVREEEMIIRGEVENEEEYGIDWQYFFDNINMFKSNQEYLQQSIRKTFYKQLSNAIQNVSSVVSIGKCSVIDDGTNKKKIQVVVSFVYQDENNNLGTLTDIVEI